MKNHLKALAVVALASITPNLFAQAPKASIEDFIKFEGVPAVLPKGKLEASHNVQDWNKDTVGLITKTYPALKTQIIVEDGKPILRMIRQDKSDLDNGKKTHSIPCKITLPTPSVPTANVQVDIRIMEASPLPHVESGLKGTRLVISPAGADSAPTKYYAFSIPPEEHVTSPMSFDGAGSAKADAAKIGEWTTVSFPLNVKELTSKPSPFKSISLLVTFQGCNGTVDVRNIRITP